MGVLKKKKRKLVIDERPFYWYVAEDLEAPNTASMMALNVISEDKHFIVRYHLQQHENRRHITVIGDEFGGISTRVPGWQRFRCPKWEKGETLTPGNVRALVAWCMEEDKSLLPVDYQGMAMSG